MWVQEIQVKILTKNFKKNIKNFYKNKKIYIKTYRT